MVITRLEADRTREGTGDRDDPPSRPRQRTEYVPQLQVRQHPLATGEIRSKDAAADWAAEHRPVLAHAKLRYLTRTYREET